MSVPIFAVYCIDYRYDELAANFFRETRVDYFVSTAAGASLPIGYPCYCTCKCNKDGCNPSNKDMNLLKNSIITNLNIALTLKPIEEIYLLNHQDCGAFRAYLSCSGYPPAIGVDNQKEIDINADVLTYARNYVIKRYPTKRIKLGLLDVNGTVADYNVDTKEWIVVYKGSGTDPKGLWYNKSN